MGAARAYQEGQSTVLYRRPIQKRKRATGRSLCLTRPPITATGQQASEADHGEGWIGALCTSSNKKQRKKKTRGIEKTALRQQQRQQGKAIDEQASGEEGQVKEEALLYPGSSSPEPSDFHGLRSPNHRCLGRPAFCMRIREAPLIYPLIMCS